MDNWSKMTVHYEQEAISKKSPNTKCVLLVLLNTNKYHLYIYPWEGQRY